MDTSSKQSHLRYHLPREQGNVVSPFSTHTALFLAGDRVSSPESAFDVVAIAASLGGLHALSTLLAALPSSFPSPILVVQHISARFPSQLPEALSRHSSLPVNWAKPWQRVRPGNVYIAPPDFHLQVSRACTLQLSQTPPVQFVRPSADVLFSSVAATFRERAIAVVLTGMRSDGARGAAAIKRQGGRVLVQDEVTSVAFGMPSAAISTGCVDFVLPLPTLSAALIALTMVPGAAALLQTPHSGLFEESAAT